MDSLKQKGHIQKHSVPRVKYSDNSAKELERMMDDYVSLLSPVTRKSVLEGLRPDKTQTSLLNYRDQVEP